MKKKVLFIDRDGTLIVEPPGTFQVDSLELLEFLPFAISTMRQIAGSLDFELVMVTNQDGLGSVSFPEDHFWPAHNKMLQLLRQEGVVFSAVHIDRSFEHEGLPTRKPGTGMLQQYLDGSYDLQRSFVIGDRQTDIQLARNLGCKSIFLGASPAARADFYAKDWPSIFQHLQSQARAARVQRKTLETDIQLELRLDGSGEAEISTGIGFFDHMLHQLARHGGFDLKLHAEGDLQVEEHHCIEDVGIVLGQAFKQALADKHGITRYGFFVLPMDDCLAQVAVDLGGRPWLVWQAAFQREKIGAMPCEMFSHFFKSFSDHAACNLHIRAEGENEHHKIEAIFKAFAKALRLAVQHSGTGELASTKGLL